MQTSSKFILFLFILLGGTFNSSFAQIIGPSKICIGDTVLFYVQNAPHDSSNWILPQSFNVISSQGSDSIKVITGLGSGTIIYRNRSIVIYSKNIECYAKPIVNAIILPDSTPCSGEPVRLVGIGANNFHWDKGVLDSQEFTPFNTNYSSAVYSPGTNFLNGVKEDIDGDGLIDVVSYGKIYRNTGIIGQPVYQIFANPIEIFIPPYSYVTYFKIKDLNLDGKPELIYFSRTYPSIIKVFWNKCTPGNIQTSSFSEVTLNCGFGANFFQIIDMNNDGKCEILGAGSQQLAVFQNNTTKDSIYSYQFQYEYKYPVNTSFIPGSVNIDIDNDGRIDLLINPEESTNVNYVLNKGKNGVQRDFSEFVTQNLFNDKQFNYGNEICVYDLNNDGLKDIIYTQVPSYNLIVAWNKSKPGIVEFEKQVVLNGYWPSNFISIQDYDGDGKGDILFTYVAPGITKYSTLTVRNNFNINSPKSDWFKDTFSLYWEDLGYSNFLFDINKDGLIDFIKLGQSWNSYRLATPSKYTVIATDTNGCMASKEIYIKQKQFQSITLHHLGSNLLCNTDSVLLIAKRVNSDSLFWFQNGLKFLTTKKDSIWTNLNGSLTVHSQLPSGCISRSNTIQISKLQKPLQMPLMSSQTICLNTKPLVLQSETNQTVNLNFQWQQKSPLDLNWVNIANTKNLDLPVQNQGKNYRRIAYDEFCQYTDTSNVQTISFHPQPSASIGVNKSIQCFIGHSFEFTDKTSNTPKNHLSNWVFSDGSKDTGRLVYKFFDKPIPAKATLIVTSQENCIDSISTSLGFVSIPSPIEICLLTIDKLTQKNAVVWERKNEGNLSGYKVYKEVFISQVYEPIAFVPADSPGYYIDLSSDPIAKADRYKIAKMDTCGNEGLLSREHKTLHLMVNQGANNTINLNWDSYEGLNTNTINIYRGPTDSTLTPLTNIQGNLFQWVDQFPLVGLNYYKIEAVFGITCNPDVLLKRNFTSASSNIANNLKTRVENTVPVDLFSLGPNPFHNELVLNQKSNQDFELVLTDMNGREVNKFNINSSTQIIDCSGMENGFYIATIKTGNHIHKFKLFRN